MHRGRKGRREGVEPCWPAGLNTINLPRNFTLRSNRSHRTTQREIEEVQGRIMGGFKRDGEHKGREWEDRHRGDKGERFSLIPWNYTITITFCTDLKPQTLNQQCGRWGEEIIQKTVHALMQDNHRAHSLSRYDVWYYKNKWLEKSNMSPLMSETYSMTMTVGYKGSSCWFLDSRLFRSSSSCQCRATRATGEYCFTSLIL